MALCMKNKGRWMEQILQGIRIFLMECYWMSILLVFLVMLYVYWWWVWLMADHVTPLKLKGSLESPISISVQGWLFLKCGVMVCHICCLFHAAKDVFSCCYFYLLFSLDMDYSRFIRVMCVDRSLCFFNFIKLIGVISTQDIVFFSTSGTLYF